MNYFAFSQSRDSIKLMSNSVRDVSKYIKVCGLTQEAPYVKEYVKGLTYRLTQERGGVLMRAGGKLQVDRRGRGGSADYLFFVIKSPSS